MAKFVMYVGGTWGNCIEFVDEGKTRIYGFRPFDKVFEDGSLLIDLAHHVNDDYIPIYLVINSKWEHDPRDMFFADINLITEIPNTYKTDKSETWYLEGCRNYNNKVDNDWNSLGFWKRLFSKKPLKFPEGLFMPPVKIKPYTGF